MTIKYHYDIEQGSDDWLALRCGVLTASEMNLIMTSTLKVAANDKSRAHVQEITAQRISQYVEPTFISDDMLRGVEMEPVARELYAQTEPFVTECGFITREFDFGFIGYSPDALVGDIGLWECKAPRQKRHVETVLSGEVPSDHILQIQTGLLVTDREWIDFSSYHGGLPMITYRVYPDERVQSAILQAAEQFHNAVNENIAKWDEVMKSDARLVPTEREIEQEVYLG